MLETGEREKTIKKATNIGIAVNIFLGVLKMSIGYITSSLAFLSDGANNLSDSLSSLVTLIGYKASKRRPTKAHPMGYGRIEYLSALFVSILVVITGFEFLKSSIAAIKSPSPISLSPAIIIILSLTVAVKLVLWLYYRKAGKTSDCLSLVAASSDSLSDAIISLITIVCGTISYYSGLSLDGTAGIIVSAFIMWTGVSSILTTSDTILGKRPGKDEVKKIREIIKEYPPLCGGYDIRIHHYGPESAVGTADVEVPFTANAEEIYEAMEKAKKRLYSEMGIIFTFGLNAENQDDERVRTMMEKTLKCIKMASDDVIGIHGFHVHFDEKRIEFDVVVSFSLKDWDSFRRNLTGILEMVFPDYSVSFNIDPDYS